MWRRDLGSRIYRGYLGRRLGWSVLLLLTLLVSAAHFGEATSRKMAADLSGQGTEIASVVFGEDKDKFVADIYLGDVPVMHLYGNVTTGVTANDRGRKIVTQLNQLASQGVELSEIRPAVYEKSMVGRVGDQTIFTIEPEDAKGNGAAPAWLAFRWCNQIREALGGAALSRDMFKEVEHDYRVATLNVVVVPTGDGASSLEMNGKVLLVLRSAHRRVSAKKRAEEVAERLREFVRAGGTGRDIIPAIGRGDIYYIRAGKDRLLQIDKLEAKRRRVSPWQLTLMWVNQFRRALWAEPFSRGDVKIAYSQTGGASWYGGRFEGRITSYGEPHRSKLLTAAHRTLPFGTHVLVTCLDTGRSVIVRINDRGPFIRGRIIDLSRRAAEEIGLIRRGVAPVRVDVIG